MERMNLIQISHDLSLCGMTAYRDTVLELVRRINQLQEQVEDLQNQLSAEIMARLAPPVELQEIVAELGAGWRIERQPITPSASAATSTPPAATTTAEDIDRQMTGVGRLLTAYQRAFIQDVDAAQQAR